MYILGAGTAYITVFVRAVGHSGLTPVHTPVHEAEGVNLKFEAQTKCRMNFKAIYLLLLQLAVLASIQHGPLQCVAQEREPRVLREPREPREPRAPREPREPRIRNRAQRAPRGVDTEAVLPASLQPLSACSNAPDGQLCGDTSEICSIGWFCANQECVERFKSDGTVCRAAAGPCDVAEVCTGDSASCPPNAFQPESFTCRAAAGICDVAEKCTGSTANCGPDLFRPASFQCRAASGVCDRAEFCTGDNPICPSDQFEATTTICRQTKRSCDLDETCTGSSAYCGPDMFAPASTVCKEASGVCDTASTCTGRSRTCPANTLRPSTFMCRAAKSDCDVGERCTGSSSTCPADLNVADATPCSSNAACPNSGQCMDGVCGECTINSVM